MTTVAIVQARYTSTRLPGKTTLPLAGRPVVAHVVDRLRQVRAVERIAVAIPVGEAQTPLKEAVLALEDVDLVEGPEDDLARRFALAVEATGATIVLRTWADCPALDPALADTLLRHLIETGAAVANIPADSGWPEGTEGQAWNAAVLLAIDAEATDAFDREALLPFIERDPARFPITQMRRLEGGGESSIKLLLDTPEDYVRLRAVFDDLHPADPCFGVDTIERRFTERPDLFAIP